MDASRAALAAALFLLVVPAALHAAAGAQALTPANQSVAGGESRDFSVRFFDASGQPAAGEAVTFANDACGWFPNGQSVYATTADATGIATARFTAYPQGITCWLVASAGTAQASFSVLTYLPADAYVAASLPSRIVPGEPFSFRAAAMYGVYDLYDADLAARIVPGTGSATISPGSANSGQDGTSTFTVTPGNAGDYAIELQFRDHVQRFPVTIGAAPWQDMWWAGPQEDGWGVSVVQHDSRLFAAIYAYDDAGQPTWYVLPSGAWNDAGTVYSGALYRPRGSPYSSYDASRFVAGDPVGAAALDFTDPARVAFTYTIAGTQASKVLERQDFGPVDAAGGAQVGDMWWGGLAQEGWGVALLQQYRSLFGVWFTYDAAGEPTWFVMPAGAWSDAQTWQGALYRTTASPWLGRPYDKSALRTTQVGSMRLRFTGDAASLDYVVDGRAGSAPIVRQGF